MSHQIGYRNSRSPDQDYWHPEQACGDQEQFRSRALSRPRFRSRSRSLTPIARPAYALKKAVPVDWEDTRQPARQRLQERFSPFRVSEYHQPQASVSYRERSPLGKRLPPSEPGAYRRHYSRSTAQPVIGSTMPPPPMQRDLHRADEILGKLKYEEPSVDAFIPYSSSEILQAIDALILEERYSDARYLSTLALEYAPKSGDKFVPFRYSGRQRACRVLQRVGRNGYAQMNPDEQVDYISYCLVPQQGQHAAYEKLLKLNTDFTNRKFEFRNPTSHCDLKESIRLISTTHALRTPNTDTMKKLMVRENSAVTYQQWKQLLEDVTALQQPDNRHFSYREKEILDKFRINALKHLYVLERSSHRQQWLDQLQAMVDQLFERRTFYPRLILPSEPPWQRSLSEVRTAIRQLQEIEQFEAVQKIMERLQRPGDFIAMDPSGRHLYREVKPGLLVSHTVAQAANSGNPKLFEQILPAACFKAVFPNISHDSSQPSPQRYLFQDILPENLKTNIVLHDGAIAMAKSNDFYSALALLNELLRWNQRPEHNYSNKERDYLDSLCTSTRLCCTILARTTDPNLKHKTLELMNSVQQELQKFLLTQPPATNKCPGKTLNYRPAHVYLMTTVARMRAEGKSWQEISQAVEALPLSGFHFSYHQDFNTLKYDIRLMAMQQKLREPEHTGTDSKTTPASEQNTGSAPDESLLEALKDELFQLHDQIKTLDQDTPKNSRNSAETRWLYARSCELHSQYYLLAGNADKSKRWAEHAVKVRGQVQLLWPAVTELTADQLFPCAHPLHNWYTNKPQS